MTLSADRRRCDGRPGRPRRRMRGFRRAEVQRGQHRWLRRRPWYCFRSRCTRCWSSRRPRCRSGNRRLRTRSAPSPHSARCCRTPRSFWRRRGCVGADIDLAGRMINGCPAGKTSSPGIVIVERQVPAEFELPDADAGEEHNHRHVEIAIGGAAGIVIHCDLAWGRFVESEFAQEPGVAHAAERFAGASAGQLSARPIAGRRFAVGIVLPDSGPRPAELAGVGHVVHVRPSRGRVEHSAAWVS